MRTVQWSNNAIKIIDQTQLPARLAYVYIRDLKGLWKAIKALKVRGAPALGAAAGLGVYLGIKDSKARDFTSFAKELDRVIRYLGSSRPTARNLFWGLERMGSVAVRNRRTPVAALKKLLFRKASAMIEEDRSACRSIARFGTRFIKNGERILTICNTGVLATIDYGTALGIITLAHEEGKRIKVFASETRPLLQGARLTTWELRRKGIDVTLICDSMAATLMQQHAVTCVITGADRIARNGDTANKIGTYNLAVLCRYHKVPFYVAAPFSTVDMHCATGGDIPIEERPSYEVTSLYFKKPIAAKGVRVFNPAFDVTPHRLITAIITDRGIIRSPFSKHIMRAARATP